MTNQIVNEELRAIYQDMRDLPTDGVSVDAALYRIGEAVKVLAFHVDGLNGLILRLRGLRK
jgi:hypothetical protein